MEQSHGNGMGEWDPNSFSNASWDHQFTDPSLGFDSHHGQDHGYPNPESFINVNTDTHISPQMSAPETQQALYRPFGYYNPGDVWTGPGQASTAYAQDHALPQGYYTEQPQQHQPPPQQQHQQAPSEPHSRQTVDSRFALVDLPQSHEFPSHHIHTPGAEDVLSHGFSNNVVRPPNTGVNGYLQEAMPQWQRAPAQATGYVPGREYENPLAAPQSVGIKASGARGSPSPYSSGHPAVVAGIPSYRGDSDQPQQQQQQQQQHHHQPHHQPHHQYVPATNGAPPPVQAPTAHLPPSVKTGSPRVTTHPLTQKAAIPKPVTQKAVPQTFSTQDPPTQIHPAISSQVSQFQARSVYPQAGSQAVPPVGGTTVSNAKRRPGSETLEPKMSAKKVRVGPDAASTSSPSLPSSQAGSLLAQTAPSVSASTPISVPMPAPVAAPLPTPPPAPAQVQAQAQVPPAQFSIDNQMIQDAKSREGGTWAGVPYLVIGAAPVQLKKGPPTKRYVVIATKGERAPLFPDLPRGWAPAESLGNHLEAYQKARSELDRQKADIRLETELKRGGNEIPVDWWKKLPKDSSNNEARPTVPPPEPDYTLIKLEEVFRIHESHRDNRAYRRLWFTEYFNLLFDTALTFKDAPALKRLVVVATAKLKNLPEYNAAEFNQLRQQLEPSFKQLETIIVRGLQKADPPALLARLGDKPALAIRLVNVVIRLVNIGETNSPLLKAILRLFGRFTSVRRTDLERWKLPPTKVKLESQGDSEIKELIGAIFRNAEKNDGKDSPARDMKPTSGAKKLAKPLAKAVSASASASASNASGAKRVREEDSSGDGRSGKKQATGASTSAPSNGAGPTPAASKPLSTITSKAPPKPPTSTSTAAVATAPKRSMLLPGKIVRPPSKSMAKPDLPKADLQKSSAKPEPMTKAPLAKADVTKPPPSKSAAGQPAPQAVDAAKLSRVKASEPPKSSRFAALLAEIDEPKKVKAPEPPPLVAADPNETDDQKKRRLRKEDRRRLNLKVTFKSDDRLVEVREFTRDPEEVGQGGAVRDVRSENKDKMEGMALRKSHAGEIRPWEEPTAIDFDVLPQDKRERTFVTRGGFKTFHTEQQKFMEDRESKELMVIYTDPADIPPTPKSPAYEPSLENDSSANTITLPEGSEYEEIRQRGRDRLNLGLWRAIEAALARLDAKTRPDYANFTKALQSVNSIADSYNGTSVVHKPDDLNMANPAFSANYRDQQVFQLLTSDRVKNYQDPDPYDPAQPQTVRRHDYRDAGFQKVADTVENLFERFRGTHPASYPQPAPQSVVAKPEPIVVAPVVTQQSQPAPDYSAAWAQYYAQQGQQQQQQAAWYNQQQPAYTQPANPYLQSQATQPVAQQPNIDAGNQLSAILTALGNPATPSQPQFSNADPSQIQALMAVLTGGQPQTQPVAPAPAADPQSAEYLLSLMKWASGQGGTTSASAVAPIPAAAYPHEQGQAGARSHQQPHNTYGQSNYGQSHQERDGYGGSETRERERDRDRDRHNMRSTSGSSSANGSWNAPSKAQADVPEHLRGINRSLIGTKQCTFYARGQCAKGDKCTFRHD